MEYPFLDQLLFHAADPADESSKDSADEAPADPADEAPTDPEDLPVGSEGAADLSGTDTTDTGSAPDLENIVGDPGDMVSREDVDALNKQIEDLKKQIEDNFDLENQVEVLKRRLDNLNIQTDADLNDSLFQSASTNVKQIKRTVRRMFAKKADLSGKQQEKIVLELQTNPQLSFQELAKKLSSLINAKEQDIFIYLSNVGFQYQHRHRRAL